jgi:Cdc6-like AAA superfamily ATPase
MVVSLSTNHASDWEWQAVLGQMEELRRLNYITKLKQDPAGSTYWTITSKGQNYLLALERAESTAAEPNSASSTGGSSTGLGVQERLLISSVIPSHDALLRLTPEEAACPLMNCLLSLSDDELNRHNLFISNYPTQGYPPEHAEKIKSKLSAAWNWLQGQGYLIPRPGNPGSDWVSITDDGRAWASDECTAARMQQLRLPKPQPASSQRKLGEDQRSAQVAPTIRPKIERAPASAEGAPAGGVEVAIRALSDKPSEVDLLEFADYAQALTDFIQNEKTQTPLTIGIDGPWGSGKTTLMRMIQERLNPKEKKETDPPPARTVWFNAWKYDREESLWASLALEILSQVRRQCRWRERVGLWFRLNWKRFDKGKFGSDLIKFVAYPAALIVATALGTFLWKRWVDPNLDIAKWTKVSAGGGLIATLLGALKQIHDQVVGPFELNISKYIRTPEYKIRVGFLGEFEKDFKFVIDAATNNAKSSLVIFVDDLDRCKPAKPVEVIEAINQLLDAEPCIFVMGMDVRTIAGSIEAKYKDLAESSVEKDSSGGLPLGYRFLEKIVQVPFRLPKVSRKTLGRLVDGSLTPREASPDNRAAVVVEAEHLIQGEEREGKDLDEAAETVRSARPDISSDALMEAKRNVFARTFDDDQEVRRAIYDALPYLESNARKVKRFINLFRLQLLIANRRHLLENKVIEIRQLSRWLVLVSCWPEIVDALNDPAFPPRLLEAHRLWRTSVRESPGLENAQAVQVLLKPYLDDPRVKRFLDVSNLIDLLRALVPTYSNSEDFSDALEPYLQLSATPQ